MLCGRFKAELVPPSFVSTRTCLPSMFISLVVRNACAHRPIQTFISRCPTERENLNTVWRDLGRMNTRTLCRLDDRSQQSHFIPLPCMFSNWKLFPSAEKRLYNQFHTLLHCENDFSRSHRHRIVSWIAIIFVLLSIHSWRLESQKHVKWAGLGWTGPIILCAFPRCMNLMHWFLLVSLSHNQNFSKEFSVWSNRGSNIWETCESGRSQPNNYESVKTRQFDLDNREFIIYESWLAFKTLLVANAAKTWRENCLSYFRSFFLVPKLPDMIRCRSFTT
jgi:hypothetical protein